jgi:hypothetical protein
LNLFCTVVALFLYSLYYFFTLVPGRFARQESGPPEKITNAGSPFVSVPIVRNLRWTQSTVLWRIRLVGVTTGGRNAGQSGRKRKVNRHCMEPARKVARTEFAQTCPKDVERDSLMTPYLKTLKRSEDYSIGDFLGEIETKIIALLKEQREMREMLDAIWYSPGMPGSAEAAMSFAQKANKE